MRREKQTSISGNGLMGLLYLHRLTRSNNPRHWTFLPPWIIISVNHNSFPSFTRAHNIRPRLFWGICPWQGLEQQFGVSETICGVSKITVTEPSSQFADYGDNDGSWFSPSCCQGELAQHAGTRQQRHLADVTGKVGLRQTKDLSKRKGQHLC